MSFIRLTHHCKEKALTRFGVSEDVLLELAEKSILNGYSINDAPNKKIKKYLKRKMRKGQKAYVYSGYVFILSKDLILITTFRLPDHLLLSLRSKKFNNKNKLY